jgi:hypothetical protein
LWWQIGKSWVPFKAEARQQLGFAGDNGGASDWVALDACNAGTASFWIELACNRCSNESGHF